MRVATEEFFSVVVHSCCCLTGLGLNMLVLFPSLLCIHNVAYLGAVQAQLNLGQLLHRD